MKFKTFRNFLLGMIFIILAIGFVSSIQTAKGISRLETDYQLTTSTSTPQTLRYQGTSTNAVDFATTTFQTTGVDHVDLNIQFQGSSTAATLVWKYEFSDNFMDWYGEDLAQTASAYQITHSSSTVLHSWTPQLATSTPVRKNVSISPVASRYMRIVFYTENATSSIHARVALKSELNR